MILAATTDKLQLVTDAAVTVDVHVSYIDASNSTLAPNGGGKQNTSISTAATTDILAAPGASTLRTVTAMKIRNKHASASVVVTLVFDQNGTDFELHKATLYAGECLEWLPAIGFFKLAASLALRAYSTAQQGAGFATDTYLTGSFLLFPIAPVVGTRYRMTFDVVKTAAGTATPIITVRVGTAGTTSDTARLTFTFGAGTAAADTGVFIVDALFRAVGSGTSAVLQGQARLVSNLATTGLSNAVKALQVTSGGFDSTVASSGIGCSYNGGTSASHTVQLVQAELIPN